MRVPAEGDNSPTRSLNSVESVRLTLAKSTRASRVFSSASICSICPRVWEICCSTSRTSATLPVRVRRMSLSRLSASQHFAIDGVEAGEALAKPQNFVGVSECAHHKFGFDVGTKEERAKSCFAMVGAEAFEGNRVELSASKRARLIASGGADHGK